MSAFAKTFSNQFAQGTLLNQITYWNTRTPSALSLVWSSATQINASWTDAENAAEGLRLYISTDNVNWTLADTVNFGVQAGSATIVAGTIYWFKLVAFKGTHESDPIYGQIYDHRVLSTQASNMLAYYPMNESSGAVMDDMSVNNLNGEYVGTPTLNSTGIGDGIGAVLFNGSNSFAYVEKNDFVNNFNGNEGAISLWIKLDASILADNLSHKIAVFYAVNDNIQIAKSAINQLTFTRKSGSSFKIITYIDPLTDDWMHICVRWSYLNNRNDLYVNGLLYRSAYPVGQWTETLNESKCAIASDNQSGNQLLKGNVAKLAIWKNTVNSGEIYSLSGVSRSVSTHNNFKTLSTKSLYRGTGTNDWLGRPNLCVNAIGEWVLVYRAAQSHSDDDGSATHHIRFSTDEGLMWSDEDKLIDGTAVGNAPFAKQGGNLNQPAIILFKCPNNDLIVIAFEEGGVEGGYQWRSADNGATWNLEGRILNSAYLLTEEDYTIVGNDIYMIVRDIEPVIEKLYLYKSTDNAVTWVKVSEIENVVDTNEAGLCYLGGTNMLVVMKAGDKAHTYQYVSADMGLTWTRTDVTSTLAIMNKPVLRKIENKVFLYGRDLIGLQHYTVVYVSTDNGTTWSEKFYPDGVSYEDGAYCDMMQRSDGTYYMISYGGALSLTDIKEYTFELK